MSVEITLYTKKASKTGLSQFLLDNGFNKTRHIFENMNTADMSHFMWFGHEDYESSTGVEATVMKSSDEEKEKYNCSDWILHTRTRSSGTFEDKQLQNKIIRIARQQFDGSFYNDWYGTNKYTDLNDYKKYTPLEKGISLIASNSLEKLNQIRNCLKGYKNEMSETIANIKPISMRSLLNTKDPSITLYNSLIPFLVSVLEYFFGQSFTTYIKYDETARLKLTEEKIKIEISEVIRILDKEKSLEQIITQSYNFQNLDSINKAFRKYVSIDIFAVLSKRKRVNKRLFRVLPKVQEILEARHRFVHELDMNYNLTQQVYLDYVSTVEKTIELIIAEFKRQGLSIETEK